MSGRDIKTELARKREQLRQLQERRKSGRRKGGSGNAAGAPTDLSALLDSLGSLPEPQRGGGMRSLRQPKLTTSETRSAAIAPVTTETYVKSCQTDVLPELEGKDDDDALPDAPPTPLPEEPEVAAANAAAAAAKAKEEEEEAKLPAITEDEAKEIMGGAAFQSFFDRSSKTVERLLEYKKGQWTHKIDSYYDPLEDYTADAGGDDDNEKGEAVELEGEFFNERYTSNRAVTSIDWATQKPELMCVSYNANPDTPHEPDGIVCLWNRHVSARPQDVFECQSAVLSCSFTPFSPHVIVGGTYSGQVVLWDNRESKRTPVQRSTINSECHTHPVFCLNVVGSKNAHSLVTASTDGKLCAWDMDSLQAPQEPPQELSSTASKAVAGTAFSFPAGGINDFVLGSEEGSIYMACRTGARINESCKTQFMAAADNPQRSDEPGHFGPVTAVDFHKVPGSADFRHLFLSSSTDWTTKLWSYQNQKKPLLTFENSSDYVYDVRWSPVHPSVFATVDGTGAMDVWNLNTDVEQPACRVTVNDGAQSLNRIKWTGDGRHLATGDANGTVYLYSVAERLSVPRADENARLKSTIRDIELSSEELIADPTTA